MTIMSMLAGLIVFLSPAIQAAENPYLDLGEIALPDAKTLQEARKQIDDYRELKVRDELDITPFHKRNARSETNKQPLCRTCHPTLPHRRSERKRSFLNMHTRYVACETCHFQPQGIDFDYRWLSYGKMAKVTANEVNTKNIPESSRKSDEKIPSIVPDEVSRLAPFFQGKPALLFKDDPGAGRVARSWDEGSDEEKARLKARLHVSLKKDGRRCADCHRRNQTLLDWRVLNASDKQLRAIEENAIAQFFARYKKKDQRLRMTELLR